jgi:hypothetical protein
VIDTNAWPSRHNGTAGTANRLGRGIVVVDPGVVVVVVELGEVVEVVLDGDVVVVVVPGTEEVVVEDVELDVVVVPPVSGGGHSSTSGSSWPTS